MPKGASTSAHRSAYIRSLAKKLAKAKASGFDPNAETLLEGKGMATLANAVLGTRSRILDAEKKLAKAKRPAAEENVLRRGYNQGVAKRVLRADVDTKEGRKRKR